MLRASLHLPSFQYMKVPQPPGCFAEVIRAPRTADFRGARELRRGAASALCATCLERAPLASAEGKGLNRVADSTAAQSNNNPKGIDFLHALA